MARVAILTPSVTSGDAVSNDVVGMHDVLQRRGFETKLFAEGWTLKQPEILPYTSIPAFLKNADDVLIYHYSRGWDPGLELLRILKCHTVVRYHNVTPPEFFVKYNTELAAMCQEGREQLRPIAQGGCDRYLSASSYNMAELTREGAPQADNFVVPPFHHIDHLAAVIADQDVLRQHQDQKTNICMVGRLSPNKGHPALIEAFSAYFHDYNRNSRLLIVGREESRLRNYGLLLREMSQRLQVDDAVVFTGQVTESALKAYYQIAHAFMITSDHEGFCVPLVEAMFMGLPIVAYASSAIPETVGDAGIVWTERDPNLLAASLNTLITNQSLSDSLSTMGRRRYEENFSNQRIEATFMRAMSGVL